VLNGVDVTASGAGTLLDALRDELGRLDVKDGCAPQGQCGCCTVLVDGAPRVACVTPLARVEGREVTTLDGLDESELARLLDAFDQVAASQCGFCTPGILVRLCAAARKGPLDDRAARAALAAHLCRCTGFQPIVEAAVAASGTADLVVRDPAAAAARATLESGTTQLAGTSVARGRAPFADDTAPAGALVALGAGPEGYELAGSTAAARRASGVRQGRNSTVSLSHPVALPPGSFDLVLQTTWVEPAYLEPDASWCVPGGEPASPFANAGAFGAKRHSPVARDARRLADERGRPVRVRWTREAVVLRGAKRPPLALGLHADGSGTLVLGWTAGSPPLDGLAASIRAACPGVDVQVEEVTGPLVGTTHRGAGLAEVLAARAVLAERGGECEVETPDGARAAVRLEGDRVIARVAAGAPLCAATLRSYVIGAVHQGLSMVTHEGIAVDEEGTPVDLTVRSFSITSAKQMPPVDVELVDSEDPPLAAGTAVFAATLAAVWLAEGTTPRWPTRR